MKVIRDTDIQKFTDNAMELLLKREAENNLPIGILHRLQDNHSSETPFLIRIQEEGKTVFVTLRTPPHLWILPSIETTTPEQIRNLACYFHDHQLDVPGVLGEQEVVHWFLEAWKEFNTIDPVLHMRQGIYCLDELQAIPQGEGGLVVADEHDRSLIEEWLVQFGEETNELLIKDRAAELTEDMLCSKRVHLWKVEGVPVSMAGRARVTPNGATINAVFTPDEYKRRGYASQAVWALSKKLMDQGCQFCALYTDMANPTSNSIYKRIGYKWIGDSAVYHFPE